MPNLKQVGRELGVRYVLEGSVRKAGGRVRITAQLIDALSGTLRWADRFDGRPRAPSFGNSIAPEWRAGSQSRPFSITLTRNRGALMFCATWSRQEYRR